MGILGSLPEVPDTDWVSGFVEACRLKDIQEDLFGDEDSPYYGRQYFEHSAREIADAMGMTTDGVYTMLKRINAKLARRLLIMAYIGKKPDDEIIRILNSGIENVRHEIKFMFI